MRTNEPIEQLYFNVSEVALILRVTPWTVRKWCRDGILPAMKANKGQYLIHKLDIPAYTREEQRKELNHE